MMDGFDGAAAAGTREISATDLRERIERHLALSIAKEPQTARLADWRRALSLAVRDVVTEPWLQAERRMRAEGGKRVYYLSMEFLIGRLLEDAIQNLGLEESVRKATAALGVDYTAVISDEPDAALGNGGLGRLAACFLDSMATLGAPGIGYGIRYAHGLFRQGFEDGWQAERAEAWLDQNHVWEFERLSADYPIGFGGEAHPLRGDASDWRPADVVRAVAYDTPIPGWRGGWVNTLRLWSAKPTREFELAAFNRGDHHGAAASAVSAETISRVLYPDDSTPAGRDLRLKQEYFFTAASLADILRRFEREHGGDLTKLPAKAAIQLNDTHPAIAGPELIRLLVDDKGMTFDAAYDIAQQCLNYTNHTLLPEALERWPLGQMWGLLPRHMQLIERIDDRHARDCAARGKPRPDSVKIIDDHHARMGDLAFIMANRVNGVSALHTELVKQTVFHDLHQLHPDRILNQTNGVTPRRWLHGCNPPLRALINEAIGTDWAADLEQLERLKPLAEDAAFRERFRTAKQTNKARLADWIKTRCGVEVPPEAMFDIQIKRIHEYKRQLLNILETAALWNAIRQEPDADWAPRVKIFGGKAAPGYFMAKLIIKLINDVGRKVNGDPLMKGRLAVVYPANYNVSMAERLIPAADLSEQISTAGMEASGTGNMKFALNGALTIGTLDGANVEICERVGEDNIFIFGKTAEEVAALRAEGLRPGEVIAAEPRLAEVLDQIDAGVFSPEQPERFRGITENLRHHDWFLAAADFGAYWDAQRRADAAWGDVEDWTRKTVLNTASSGWFSSDRTIAGYAADVWGLETGMRL